MKATTLSEIFPKLGVSKFEVEEYLEVLKREAAAELAEAEEFDKANQFPSPEEILEQLEAECDKTPSVSGARDICLLTRSASFDSLSLLAEESPDFSRIENALGNALGYIDEVLAGLPETDDSYDDVSHYRNNVTKRIQSLDIVSSDKPLDAKAELLCELLAH